MNHTNRGNNWQRMHHQIWRHLRGKRRDDVKSKKWRKRRVKAKQNGIERKPRIVISIRPSTQYKMQFCFSFGCSVGFLTKKGESHWNDETKVDISGKKCVCRTKTQQTHSHKQMIRGEHNISIICGISNYGRGSWKRWTNVSRNERRCELHAIAFGVASTAIFGSWECHK